MGHAPGNLGIGLIRRPAQAPYNPLPHPEMGDGAEQEVSWSEQLIAGICVKLQRFFPSIQVNLDQSFLDGAQLQFFEQGLTDAPSLSGGLNCHVADLTLSSDHAM